MSRMVRVTIKVTPEVFQELERYRAEFGLTRTLMGGLCLKIGLRALVRSFAPETVMDDETLERILKKAKDIGVELSVGGSHK